MFDRAKQANAFLRAGAFRGMDPVDEDKSLSIEDQRRVLRHGDLMATLAVKEQRLTVTFRGQRLLERPVPSLQTKRSKHQQSCCFSHEPVAIQGWIWRDQLLIEVIYFVSDECSQHGLNGWIGPIIIPQAPRPATRPSR